MTQQPQRAIFPIYTSKGDAEAFLVYPYLYNRTGEWIGWVTADRMVYSVLGFFVGELTAEPRIIRKRITSSLRPRKTPPQNPGRVTVPATVPLAPMMKELRFGVSDVLQDEPERLHTSDSGELKEDMN